MCDILLATKSLITWYFTGAGSFEKPLRCTGALLGLTTTEKITLPL